MTETLAGPVVPAAEERARLKEGVHIERSSRRVRTYFGGKLIADSEHVLLVYETKRPPAYWFPIADVRMEYLEASHQAADTIRWHLAVKDRTNRDFSMGYTGFSRKKISRGLPPASSRLRGRDALAGCRRAGLLMGSSLA